jgi:hypothetical protein
MTHEEFAHLKRGDLVRGKWSGVAYIVTSHYGSHVTAVRTVDLTNPAEWDLVSHAPHPVGGDDGAARGGDQPDRGDGVLPLHADP